MEITWTTKYSLFVTDSEMKEIVDEARDYMRVFDREDAIEEAVRNYLAGQDDSIFYSITIEAINQIEAEVNKLLTE
jgi:hypothetical protein